MAHRGRDTGGSQFFICQSREQTKHLDRQHTCFRKVTVEIEFVEKINQEDVLEKFV